MKKIITTSILVLSILFLNAQTLPKVDGKEVISTLKEVTKGTGNVLSSVKQSTINAIDSTGKAIKEGTHFVDTSSTFRMVYTDFKSGLLGIATALKVGAEHVYIVIVKQQIVRSIVYILLFLLSITFIFIGYCIGKKIGWKEDASALSLFLFIPGVIIFIIAMFHIDILVMGIINPEYGAMQDIIEMVKSMK